MIWHGQKERFVCIVKESFLVTLGIVVIDAGIMN